MPHPLVAQLCFARSEFVRALDGVSEADGIRRLKPMNCIAWNVGHLASQEQTYWGLPGTGADALSCLEQDSRLGMRADDAIAVGDVASVASNHGRGRRVP